MQGEGFCLLLHLSDGCGLHWGGGGGDGEKGADSRDR